jgi:hypothetical protein
LGTEQDACNIPGWPSPTDSEVNKKWPGAMEEWAVPLGAI